MPGDLYQRIGFRVKDHMKRRDLIVAKCEKMLASVASIEDLLAYLRWEGLSKEGSQKKSGLRFCQES